MGQPKSQSAKRPTGRSAADFMPALQDLESLRQAATKCRGCDLYRQATQTVFGIGAKQARVLLVGEQPGDYEDKQGLPFVGPAGKLLDRTLLAAKLPKEECYLTNVVKHFKFEWRGQRRLHKKPRQIEITACLPWLEAEIDSVKPQVIVCLGATAAQALLGKKFKISEQRGRLISSTFAPFVLATAHPSSVLRSKSDEERHAALAKLVDDLRQVTTVLSDLARQKTTVGR